MTYTYDMNEVDHETWLLRKSASIVRNTERNNNTKPYHNHMTILMQQHGVIVLVLMQQCFNNVVCSFDAQNHITKNN